MSTKWVRTVYRHSALSWPLAMLLVVGATVAAHAKGGPRIAVLGPGAAALAVRPPIVPTIPPTSPDLGDMHGFNVTGFIQDATVSGSRCPSVTDRSQWGGTLTVNGLTIIVPCNMTLQFPAATFSWADMLDPSKFKTTGQTGSLTLNETGRGPGHSGVPFPSVEISVSGNIVAGEYIAGLILISEQSLNSSVGYVTQIDHANGALYVSSTANGKASSYVQVNDPTARFSIGKSPDTRFSVDDANPTIRAMTGYPMCIPRVAPPLDDAKCPQRNRPLAPTCRNFRAAGFVLRLGRDLAPPAKGQVYCSGFVMPEAVSPLSGGGGPNPYFQAPFEVGDFITFSGTLMRGQGPGGTDFISAHTINANVGIFTQPGTLPSYIAIDKLAVGPDAPLTFNGVPQEPADRLIAEASVTDINSIVDFYMIDVDPVSGAQVNRWVTPVAMTGGTGGVGSNGLVIDGGITTQLVGPQPGRVRIRANKATPGILLSPTRYMRAAIRSLCDPANINGTALELGAAVGSRPVDCLKRAKVANELYSGQYFAPVFEFIFPENLVPGDPIVPFDFWDLNFIVSGEGPGTGPLFPRPW